MNRAWNRACRLATLTMCLAVLAVFTRPAAGQLKYRGVNIAGAEFAPEFLPGLHGKHYIYPSQQEIDYFLGKGMNTIRLPFRWERLQRKMFAPFDPGELDLLTDVVEYATSKGAFLILDPHNYARYREHAYDVDDRIGGPHVPYAAFNDFWSRLAIQFKGNDHVIFGLMNEPFDMPTEQWREAAQQAIDAIRLTGATNLILVPGNAWTGAHSWMQDWYGTPNGVEMLKITDPADNMAFEVHQYLDENSSGTKPEIWKDANIGKERLEKFTTWLKEHKRKGFLGEFAVANSKVGPGEIGDEAIKIMLGYMQEHSNVWLGYTWWAAGQWWNNPEYMFTIEPIDLGLPTQQDRPVMTLLLSLCEPDCDLSGGLNIDDFICFQTRYALGDPQADCDGSGGLDIDDFICYQTKFALGC